MWPGTASFDFLGMKLGVAWDSLILGMRLGVAWDSLILGTRLGVAWDSLILGTRLGVEWVPPVLTIHIKDVEHSVDHGRIQWRPNADLGSPGKLLLRDRGAGNGEHHHGDGEVIQGVEQLAEIIELGKGNALQECACVCVCVCVGV